MSEEKKYTFELTAAQVWAAVRGIQVAEDEFMGVDPTSCADWYEVREALTKQMKEQGCLVE